MREQDTGQREAPEDFFFYKAIYKQQCLHFGIRIYRSCRLHGDEEGARGFPVK